MRNSAFFFEDFISYHYFSLSEWLIAFCFSPLIHIVYEVTRPITNNLKGGYHINCPYMDV